MNSDEIESTRNSAQETGSNKTSAGDATTAANEPVMTGGGFLRCSVIDPEARDQIGCAIINEDTSTKINISGLRDNLIEAFDEKLNKLEINFTYTDEGAFHWISSLISIDISLIRVRAAANLQGLGNQNELVEVQDESQSADAGQFTAISDRQVNAQGSAWYRGNTGINCLTTCLGNGGVNRLTLETSSNESFCRELIVAMGLTIQSVNTTDFAAQNLGCLFRPDLGILYISGANNIDLNLGQGGIERICSCVN
ncbi:MAG: hypothetical protein ACOH5I_23410 [Oligoflexus sp.]